MGQAIIFSSARKLSAYTAASEFISGSQYRWWKAQSSSASISDLQPNETWTRMSLSPSGLVAIVRDWALKQEMNNGEGKGGEKDRKRRQQKHSGK